MHHLILLSNHIRFCCQIKSGPDDAILTQISFKGALCCGVFLKILFCDSAFGTRLPVCLRSQNTFSWGKLVFISQVCDYWLLCGYCPPQGIEVCGVKIPLLVPFRLDGLRDLKGKGIGRHLVFASWWSCSRSPPCPCPKEGWEGASRSTITWLLTTALLILVRNCVGIYRPSLIL